MTELENTLKERGSRYGAFADNARVSQYFKGWFRGEDNLREKRGQRRLTESQMETLDNIAIKLSRILTGDADYEDNWLDIAGYATLQTKAAPHL